MNHRSISRCLVAGMAIAATFLLAHTLAPIAAADAPGYSHTCHVRVNHTVVCWGDGWAGKLGYGSTEDIGDDEVPGNRTVDLGPTDTATAVAEGDVHTCAIRTDASVVCWGAGSAVGYGNIETIGDDETPGNRSVDLGQVDTARDIAVGFTHTCAIRTDGTVVCWGGNYRGQLGYGHTEEIGDDEAPGSRTVDLGSTDTAKAIAAHGEHTCAIRTDDTVVCWGHGYNGQLGYGNTEIVGDDEVPGGRVVDLGSIDTAKRIAAGADHTCAIRTDDTVVCWGANHIGQLGYGHTESIGDDEQPGDRTVDLGATDTATAISLGRTHSCAVRTNETVVCWGGPAFVPTGVLGYGEEVRIGDDELPGERTVDLGADDRARDVHAPGDHTCATRVDWSVVCWGVNLDGRLGYGSTDDIGDDETPGARVVDLGDAADLTPPDTRIDSGPAGTTSSTDAELAFSGSPAWDVDRFQCSLDGAGWQPCTSPKAYSGLAAGSHAFRVRAVDVAGNADPSPASRSWTIEAEPGQACLDAKDSLAVAKAKLVRAKKHALKAKRRVLAWKKRADAAATKRQQRRANRALRRSWLAFKRSVRRYRQARTGYRQALREARAACG